MADCYNSLCIAFSPLFSLYHSLLYPLPLFPVSLPPSYPMSLYHSPLRSLCVTLPFVPSVTYHLYHSLLRTSVSLSPLCPSPVSLPSFPVSLSPFIGGGTRGAGGATAPPDFKIYAFGPPRFAHPKLTNFGWKSFLSIMLVSHVQLS